MLKKYDENLLKARDDVYQRSGDHIVNEKQQLTYRICPSWSCSTGCVIMAT